MPKEEMNTPEPKSSGPKSSGPKIPGSKTPGPNMPVPGMQGPRLDTFIWYAIFALWLSMMFNGMVNNAQVENLPYSTFISYIQEGRLDDVSIGQQEITGIIKDTAPDGTVKEPTLLEGVGKETTKEGATANKDAVGKASVGKEIANKDSAGKAAPPKPKRFRTIKLDDPQLATRLAEHKIKFQGTIEDNFWKSFFSFVIPIVFVMAIWSLLINRFANKDGMGPGLGLMSIEKSRAKVYMESNVKTTFKDVAGVDEAKGELEEVIGFLKEPERYNRLGGHLPKGILLVGPPGTGKTLLARAVAGEAGVPFFSISGSEFVEMFVGVGAARVRDLFAQAQKTAPCIIFIDELDALGRARGLNPMGGGHDEKEQTLNQLLVEMDGFDPRLGVILLAATNRPEILDQALLRAGRFDRHVLVDRPDRIGRAQILQVHMRGVTCDDTVKPDDIAASTPGFTGADLANLVNEAVLLATRRNAVAVQADDFTAALERVVAGLEKKNRLLNIKERTVVAFHEMGHALVALSIPGSDPIQKVSIIPRGIGALGYTMQRPTEDRFLMSREELENKLSILLGGRAAETIVFGDVSTGASDDLSKATDVARSMATRYGMVKELGPITYENETQSFLTGYQNPYPEARHFSEETAREIDCAVRDLINNALARAIKILEEHRENLDEAANLLLTKETLGPDDLSALLKEKSKTGN